MARVIAPISNSNSQKQHLAAGDYEVSSALLLLNRGYNTSVAALSIGITHEGLLNSPIYKDWCHAKTELRIAQAQIAEIRALKRSDYLNGAREKGLPFEPLAPNVTTIKAFKEARRGNLEIVSLKGRQALLLKAK